MVNYPAVRHPDEASLMKRALNYDPNAVTNFLNNLSSADSRHCKILQETVHDLNAPLIWYQLLYFLALHRWGNQVINYRLTDSFACERIDQAIVEVFTQDDTIDEKLIKDTVLHEAQDHPEEGVQYAAAYILGLRHDSSSIPILTTIIDKGSKEWKLRAVKALSALKQKECAPPLMKALVIDRKKLHREARRALQNLGPLAKSVWLDALNHPDSHIRWEAAHGLGQIGDPRAALTLAEGLFDENYVVRWATANVLAKMGDPGVPATLSVLSSHEISEPFRQAAYHALHGCTSLRNHESFIPLLEALSGSNPCEPVAWIAQRLLKEWQRLKR